MLTESDLLSLGFEIETADIMAYPDHCRPRATTRITWLRKVECIELVGIHGDTFRLPEIQNTQKLVHLIGALAEG